MSTTYGGLGLAVAAVAYGGACLVTPQYPPIARIACPACEAPGPRPPGTELAVSSSWRSECPNPLDMEDLETAVVACADQRYRLRVRCAGPCAVRGAGLAPSTGIELDGAGSIVVIPTAVGPFSFDVELEQLDTGERVHYRSPELTIRAPEAT